MPKMRGFKPEIWTDDKFVELSPFARLLFMGMWNYACDNGHLDDKPKQLKMRVLPVDSADAGELIDEMVTLGMVERETTGLTIPKLRDHQRLDNRYFTWCDRCSLDEIPEPARSKHPDYTTSAHGDTSGTRSAHAEPRVKEGRKEGSREGEGEGEGRKEGKSGPRKRRTQLPDDFRPSDEHVALAAELGVDLRAEWPKFVDHWRSKGEPKADWPATLRNWIRNSRQYGGNVQPLRPQAGPNGHPVLPPLPLDDKR